MSIYIQFDINWLLKASGSGSVVERHLAKVNVAGPNPVSRSSFLVILLMKVDARIIKKENSSAILEIKVDQEIVRKEFDRVIEAYLKNTNLAGFRKGKAPTNLIKTRFKNKINEDVLGNLVPRAYTESVRLTEIAPYTVPEIKIEDFDENSLKFKADVQLHPEVRIGQYKDLSFHKDGYKISSNDIDKELEKLQERFADHILKEGKKIENDDVVFLKVEAFDNEKNYLKEISDESYKIEMKKDILYEEFYKNLIGTGAGDEKEFNKKYPEDFNNESLAGKEITFKTKIKEVREKKFPELDDEFAKDVGDYNSLEELRRTIEKQLREVVENQLNDRLEKSMIEKIREHSEFEMPERLIKERSSSLLNGFKQNLNRYGHDLKSMMERKVIDMSKIQSEIRQQATNDLKDYLIMVKIAELENIRVEKEEIDDCLKKEAVKYKLGFEEYKKKMNEDMNLYIKHNIMTRKVLDFLKNNNKIKKGKTYKVEDILKEEVKKR